MKLEHDLPWKLEDLNGANISDNRTLVEREEINSLSEPYDYKCQENKIVLGDGKNIYELKINAELPGSEDLFDVTGSCVGVCNPDKYQGLMREEGFEAVIEYVTAPEYKPRYDGEMVISNPEEVPRYVPEKGLVYPEVETDSYGDVNNTDFAKGKILED